MKPRLTLIIEFGWFGVSIARRDVRLGFVRVWACRHSVLDHMTSRRVPIAQPRGRDGRFARVGNAAHST